MTDQVRASSRAESNLTAVELIKLYRDRELAPSEYIDQIVNWIDIVDPLVQAVETPLFEIARSAATQSDRAWRQGQARSLEGVPLGVKSVIAVAGAPRTGGSLAFAHSFQVRDSYIVRQLRSDGMIPVATLHSYELGLSNDHASFGVTRNPHDLTRHPGGSSSGPAVAVASGEVPVAIGTDTAGSVRLPAAWCNVTGFKPTNGHVQLTGILPLAPTFDCVGYIARSAQDVALVSRLASPRPGGETLRLGVALKWADGYDHRVQDALARSSDVFQELGYDVREVDLGGDERLDDALWGLVLREAANAYDEDIARKSSPLVASQLQRGRETTTAAMQEYASITHAYSRRLACCLEGVELLLVPGAPCLPPRLDDGLAELRSARRPWHEIALNSMAFANAAGLPAIAIPAGLPRPLPVGVQIVGRRGEDARVLGAAIRFQSLTEFHQALPTRAELLSRPRCAIP